MYELVKFSTDKLVKAHLFDNTHPIKEKLQKLEQYGEWIFQFALETNEPFFAIMAETGQEPMIIVEENGWKQVTDTKAIEAIIDTVLEQNPDNVAAYKGGKQNLMGWFVGQIMKQSKGTANPALVNQILKSKLG